jgi:hypothetical protein
VPRLFHNRALALASGRGAGGEPCAQAVAGEVEFAEAGDERGASAGSEGEVVRRQSAASWLQLR